MSKTFISDDLDDENIQGAKECIPQNDVLKFSKQNIPQQFEPLLVHATTANKHIGPSARVSFSFAFATCVVPLKIIGHINGRIVPHT